MCKTKKGTASILAIFLISFLLLVFSALSQILIIQTQNFSARFNSLKAFYLAQAGIERAKWHLNRDPDWATDLPHSPADDKNWLVNLAQGYVQNLGDGYYKVVKEAGKERVYSIGCSQAKIRIIKAAADKRIEL